MALSRRSGNRFQGSIWPGFVDAMTGLLLVLMFVLTIFMVVQFVLRETISGQESELDALGSEVQALASALGLEERRNTQLTAQMGELSSMLDETQDELSTAQAQLNSQSAVIASLTAERNQQAQALDAAQIRIASFEDQVATLLANARDAETQIADLETDRAELMSEQEALNLALAQARDEVDEQTEAARLAAARREALTALVEDLRARGAESESAAEALQSRVIALESELSEEEKARLAEAAAAEALRERLQNADAELTAMTLALEEQRRTAEETLTLLAAAEAAQASLDEKLLLALQQKREAEAARAELGTELAEADASREELTAALAAIRAERDDLQAQLASVQDQAVEKDDLRRRLIAALAAQEEAEEDAAEKLSLAEQREVLLARARESLSEQEAISTRAQEQTVLLNQQVGALRTQLGNLQALLDDYEERDSAQRVQLQNLGTDLNAALARVAAEERRSKQLAEEKLAISEENRALEEAERQRLEAEKANLEKYRSDFFGRLREVLDDEKDIRIEGDRFVFSSEVLFPPAQAELSDAGKAEVAKVAQLLQRIADDIPPEINWVIRVDGHTDSTPLGPNSEFADNWELSQARALSVVRYLSEDLGIDPDHLAANGFGEYQPLNPAQTPEAYAQNRRIELKLTER
ncbi:peptidoglycan -binding protein [Chachezhania antarctica]|uniref:peptidoglycan -binding protein n=1 Tax=Chachezhania antarctica TaxID=2340860 RepID=UPI000EB17155|nr:peptidoglycan -binding protein [Chachezhania antarctica]|tara:strand:+ start:404 stop:2350 length:1947 start_codon:yes stop_codon:yes gene_type:complete